MLCFERHKDGMALWKLEPVISKPVMIGPVINLALREEESRSLIHLVEGWLLVVYFQIGSGATFLALVPQCRPNLRLYSPPEKLSYLIIVCRGVQALGPAYVVPPNDLAVNHLGKVTLEFVPCGVLGERHLSKPDWTKAQQGTPMMVASDEIR